MPCAARVQCSVCYQFNLCNDCMPLQRSTETERARKTTLADVDLVLPAIDKHLKDDTQQNHKSAPYPASVIVPVEYDDPRQQDGQGSGEEEQQNMGPSEQYREKRCREIVDEGQPIGDDRDLWVVMTSAKNPRVRQPNTTHTTHAVASSM